ncbi:MAG: hypothetical protein ACTSYR_01005, partial [Candidatus Odinarchaeia archaeon]
MSYVTEKEIEKEINRLRNKGILSDVILDELNSKLKELKITKKELKRIIEETIKAYKRALVEPGEAVGTVAAQSMGEPGTQMSLPGTESVIIKEGDYIKIVQIGDFIDELISNSYFPNNPPENDSIICNIPETFEIFVPCLNSDEKITWCRLEQVSRHLPNGELLKITTRSGREIIATLSHSFLTRVNNKVVPIKGSDLKLGCRIPVVKNLPVEKPIKNIPVEMYLPKTEVWYGSEIETAHLLDKKWAEGYNVLYTVPVKKSTLFIALKNKKYKSLKPGYVYSQNYHNVDSLIPEKFILNFSNGWFIGAYLAEGSNSGISISITNNDEGYQRKVIEFAKKLGLTYTISKSEEEYGLST